MTSLDQAIETTPTLVTKLFSYQHGALAIMAAPGSYGLTELLDILIAETSIKDLLIPMAATVILLVVYCMIWVFDFFLGLRASKHEAAGEADWFHSSKAWSSCIKLFVVIIVLFALMFLSCISSMAGWWGAPTVLTISLGVFGIMAILFDLYSIGENQKRLTGKKAPIFTFLEKIGATIEKGFTTKITNWFA